MKNDTAVTLGTLQQLRSVRQKLLQLHKVLLDYQTKIWERNGGRINNSYELLNLVMHSLEFSWLHRLSELIVQIDELLDADDARETVGVSLLDEVKLLLMPSEEGDEFQRKYFEALQESPDVVLAHSEVVAILGKKSREIH
jgi:hypothetical protein